MIGKILDRLFVVFGAIVFLQFPLFMQQYQLQLSGSVHELQWQVRSMQNTAQQSDKTLEQYIEKFVSHSDRDFANQGFVMKKVLKRYQSFSKALDKLQKANLFTRPFLFIYFIQGDLAKSTWQFFQPGLLFSTEALMYALIGMILGYLVFYILGQIKKYFFKKTKLNSRL